MIARTKIIDRIASELERAYAKHGRAQWGRHEFYAIIKEELDEVWDNIKADGRQDELEKEIIQVAAMVFRYLETGDRYRATAGMSCPACGQQLPDPERPAFLKKIMD